MKQKLTLLFSLIILFGSAFAQNTDSKFSSATKGKLFGIHFNALDIKTPLTFKSAATTRTFSNLKDMDYGFSLSYWKGLTKTIDFSTRAGLIFHDYATEDRGELNNNKQNVGIELEPSLNFRPYGDNSLIAPFATLGVGGGMYTGKFGAYAPVGVGAQLNLRSITYVILQAQYRFALTKDVMKDNLFYSLGFAQNIGKAKPQAVAPPDCTCCIRQRWRWSC